MRAVFRGLGLLSQATYFLKHYALFGVSLEALTSLSCLAGIAYLGLRGWRRGFSWWHWLIMLACVLVVGVLVWLRRRRYVFFAPAPFEPNPDEHLLHAEEVVRVRGSGLLEVEGLSEHYLDVPAIFWITELGEYILMAHVTFRKLPILEAIIEEQGVWYAFIKPEDITRIRAGYLHFGLRPNPAIQLSYQGAEGDERLLCLSFAGLQAQSRLIHDISSRTGLPLGPSS